MSESAIADSFWVEAFDCKVTICRSAGADGAVVVYVDTGFEPDGSDEGPGLRVQINDSTTYKGVDYKPKEDD